MRLGRLAVLCGLVAVTGWPAPAQASVHVVHLSASGFDPATITIGPTETIRWQNDDLAPHQVAADDGSWQTPAIPPHDYRDTQFTTEGTWPFHDDAGHHGRLTVSKSVTTSTASTSSTSSTSTSSTTSTTARSSTTSSSSTTTTTLTPTTFAFEPVPEESTTSTTSTAVVSKPGGRSAAGPVHHDKGAPTGLGIVAALLLLGTSGAALLVLRRGQ